MLLGRHNKSELHFSNASRWVSEDTAQTTLCSRNVSVENSAVKGIDVDSTLTHRIECVPPYRDSAGNSRAWVGEEGNLDFTAPRSEVHATTVTHFSSVCDVTIADFNTVARKTILGSRILTYGAGPKYLFI